jgi:hypothetical protein
MKEFPIQQVLELACAAQRVNGAYIKVEEPVYDDDNNYKLLYIRHSNKILMSCTLNPNIWTADPKDAPMPLKTLPEDVALAEDIKQYYKRLLFAAIEGENDFQTTINNLLNGEVVPLNQLGFIACLPSVYARDKVQNKIKKIVRTAEDGYLGEIGSTLVDLDAEIISSVKSKNYEGYNIDAIINSKMASWLSKSDLAIGPAVIVKAKVKDHSKHWKHQNDVTRLNFVKAAQ